MIRVLLLLLLALAHPALGQTARVTSGEHDGFTRLVVALPGSSPWILGRTAMGYGFAAVGAGQPDYDLGRVWDLIPRTRLQSLRIDAESGALQLALACDCHVFPFEYRPGIVVLDIKDGPPPAGSVFEQPFGQGATAPPAPPDPVPIAGYNWLADRPPATGGPRPRMDLPELATGSVSLQSLRDQLLAQISRGAAQGIVQMEMPGKAPRVPNPGLTDLPWSQIHIGDLPGIAASPGGGSTRPVIPTVCLPDKMLDLPAWGEGRAPLDLLSAARSGFYGEFDEIEPRAAIEAVQGFLYLGFGAEARQVASLVPAAVAPPELAHYRSMSHLVDGDSDPDGPFATMLPCDGPAALWAALAADRLPLGPEVNVDAVLRSFLALPAHLRQGLGPVLADRLLARGDESAARVIRDAMERAPHSNRAEIAHLDAKVDLQAERPEAAQGHAEVAVAAAGSDAAPLVTLVEAHSRRAEPISPEVVATLQSVLGESEGRSDEAAIRRALILALALSGRTDEAFATAAIAPPPDLWRIAGQLAPDDDFLAHLVLGPEVPPPAVPGDVRRQIARRLLDLGFADPALKWLGPPSKSDPPEHRLLAARAELARGAPQDALARLGDLDQGEAATLRAGANLQLKAYEPAREALIATGQTDLAAQALVWGQDWRALSEEGDATWQAAAELLAAPPPESDPGLLAAGNRLAEDGAAARAALEALLAAVQVPAAP